MASKIVVSPELQEMYNTNDAYKSYDGVSSQERTSALSQYNYINIEPGRSVRPSFNRDDYTGFRPGESTSGKQKKIIKMCMDAYDNVGIIHNTIDLMSDFASQGLTIVHSNKTIERFSRKWFDKIKGYHKTERFINYLLRTGNVFVRRTTAKLTPKEAKQMKSKAALTEQKLSKREVPWGYEFLNPMVVDYKMVDGRVQMVMNITNATYDKMLTTINEFSDEVKKTIKEGARYIPLSPQNVRAFHYKKDDWLLWANPMVRPILDDVVLLEKMKLADAAALDGAISNIRLWNIGDLEHKIMPKKAIVDKLRDILASNVGGGTMDLIWGPDLKFSESSTQVYKFLGSQKYEPVLTSIYGGLGIPLSLTGAGGTSGYTNNFVSLKALIERLEYVRQVLLEFWEYEFKLMADAMDFASPPKIRFDTVVLSDEASVKAIMIDMWDRNLISTETLHERFKEVPDVEKSRIASEHKEQQVPDSVKKASPFHDPHYADDIAKTALQSQQLDGKDYLDKFGLKYQKPPAPKVAGPGGSAPRKKAKKTPSPTGGRPKNANDKVKRKTKVVKPKTSSYLWAMNAQKEISEIIVPKALAHFGKKNVRSLTNDQFNQLEDLKLSVLVSLPHMSEVNEETVKAAIDSGRRPSTQYWSQVSSHVEEFTTEMKRKPNIEEIRNIYAITLAEMCIKF